MNNFRLPKKDELKYLELTLRKNPLWFEGDEADGEKFLCPVCEDTREVLGFTAYKRPWVSIGDNLFICALPITSAINKNEIKACLEALEEISFEKTGLEGLQKWQ